MTDHAQEAISANVMIVLIRKKSLQNPYPKAILIAPLDDKDCLEDAAYHSVTPMPAIIVRSFSSRSAPGVLSYLF